MIDTLLAQLTDILGTPRGKLLPISRLQEVIDIGAGFSGPSIEGTGLPRNGPCSEYYGRLQADTVRPLPWLTNVAYGVCDGYADGQPLDTCSRQLLKAQLQRLTERGWTLWVGLEPEFFLLRQSTDGHWQAADVQDNLDKPSYDLKSLGRQHALLTELRQQLQALGFEIEQIDHEDANGQFEINYRFDHALAAADRFQLFKMTAHAVAEKHGQIFSLMPKPFAGMPGSGLHMHLSITDASGQAVFDSQGSPFIAGLLRHADALAALCAPSVNSYRRLAVSHSASGTTWSPVWKAHGPNNRTCLIRTVAGRIEWRLPDPSCNIYAAIAATLAAGLDGITQQWQPPPACEIDLYQAFAAHAPMPERLPRDLHAALTALEANQDLQRDLSQAFCQAFLTVKWAEWDAYAQTISTWELERYAR